MVLLQGVESSKKAVRDEKLQTDEIKQTTAVSAGNARAVPKLRSVIKEASLSESDIERAEFIGSDAALITILNPGEDVNRFQEPVGVQGVHIPSGYTHGQGGVGEGEPGMSGLRDGEIVEFSGGERGIVLNLQRNSTDTSHSQQTQGSEYLFLLF